MNNYSETIVSDVGAKIYATVTVNTYKGEAKVQSFSFHNNATGSMLIGIARFLRGDFRYFVEDCRSFIPYFLAVGNLSGDSQHVDTLFSDNTLQQELQTYTNRFQVARDEITTASNEVALTLKAVIPSGAFPAGTHINELGLFPTRVVNDGGLLARVVYRTANNEVATSANDNTGANHIIIREGYSNEIIWQIKISNS